MQPRYNGTVCANDRKECGQAKDVNFPSLPNEWHGQCVKPTNWETFHTENLLENTVGLLRIPLLRSDEATHQCPLSKGYEATHQRPLGAVACCSRFLLTFALLMTSSLSKVPGVRCWCWWWLRRVRPTLLAVVLELLLQMPVGRNALQASFGKYSQLNLSCL